MKISLEECVSLIEAASGKTETNTLIAEFKDSGIQVINGRYGPYIKSGSSNYRIPKGTDAASLTESMCKEIIDKSKPTVKSHRRIKKT